MEKLQPPSYDETIAGSLIGGDLVKFPGSCIMRTAAIAGPSTHSARSNTTYISAEALHYAPTAPTIGVIESVGAPLLSIAPLTEAEVRAALYQHKKDFGCNGSKFIRDMILTDIQNDCAFHYKLESFGEKRESTPRIIGYYGQNVDGPENGMAPDKWNVPIGVPTKFIDHQITTEIPHTAYVKECSTCEGENKIDCTSCWARGTVSCRKCDGGSRDPENNDCQICRGSGNEECFKCSGRGVIDCSFCDGYGRVKYFMLLIVTWKNHIDEFVSNRYTVPEELILQERGQEIFTKQANQVEPLNTAHVTLNEASAVLIEKHHSSIKKEAILAQRHSLRAVPLTRATYVWRNKKGEFYVYGFERNVYFQEYPRFCLCVCS